MKRKIQSLLLAAGSLLALGGISQAVVINEIRIDEPGTDVNEYIELKGTPGESLDGIWYLAIADHSNFGNPVDPAPFYGFGVVEFAFDLTGFMIPEDGYLLLAEATINMVPFEQVDFDPSDLIFENSNNVTHLLVRGYTGPAVEKDSDQWGDLAVDIDDDNDGIVNATLPWTEIVDGVSLMRYPNDNLPDGEAPDYGPSLGVPSVGPDRAFLPGHVFRNTFDGSWSIGPFSLVGGLNLDTPGAENSKAPFINFFQPTIIPLGDTLTVSGTNFADIESVKINGVNVDYTLVSSTEISVQVPTDSTGGPILVTTAYGATQSGSDLRVLPSDRQMLFIEDFEFSLGDFLVISLQGSFTWVTGSFGGRGYAQMAGFDRNGVETGNEDWLISPEIDLTGTTDPVLNFATARRFADSVQGLEVFISTTYQPGVPNINDWTPLAATLSPPGGVFPLTESGDIDLSAYIGQKVRIAFRYTSASSASADSPTWQVHELYVTDAKPSFQPGWEFSPVYGWHFRFTEEWAYNLTLGWANYLYAPWIYTGNFGYIYFLTGNVPDGGWVYLSSPKNGAPFDYVWVDDVNGGWFQYTSGQYDNFILPQF